LHSAKHASLQSWSCIAAQLMLVTYTATTPSFTPTPNQPQPPQACTLARLVRSLSVFQCWDWKKINFSEKPAQMMLTLSVTNIKQQQMLYLSCTWLAFFNSPAPACVDVN